MEISLQDRLAVARISVSFRVLFSNRTAVTEGLNSLLVQFLSSESALFNRSSLRILSTWRKLSSV